MTLSKAAGHVQVIKQFRHGQTQVRFVGGFVDYGEDPSIAVVRELEEETHLKMKAGAQPQLVTVRGHPDRDPRQHIVTIAYFVPLDIESLPDMRGDDDAKEAAWFPLEDLRREKAIEFHCQPVRLAFDHQSIINEFYSCLTQGFPPLQ